MILEHSLLKKACFHTVKFKSVLENLCKKLSGYIFEIKYNLIFKYDNNDFWKIIFDLEVTRTGFYLTVFNFKLKIKFRSRKLCHFASRAFVWISEATDDDNKMSFANVFLSFLLQNNFCRPLILYQNSCTISCLTENQTCTLMIF